MLRTLHKMRVWWLRTGEGPFVSRSINVASGVLIVAGLYLAHVRNDKDHRERLIHARHLIDRLGMWLGIAILIITILIVFRAFLLLPKWFWNRSHPAGELPAKYLLDVPPEPDRNSPYQFHLVESLAELTPYVDESEYFLSESNPELALAERRELYERWFKLNPRSFLYLTRADRRCPVALSIILPLTKCGYERLYGINRPQKKVIEFDQEEIARKGPYHYLLVDTFIISLRRERIGPNRYKGKTRYGRTLLLRHIALFWKDSKTKGNFAAPVLGKPNPQDIKIIAETEKPSLLTDMRVYGFIKKKQSAIGCALYEFEYPGTGHSQIQNRHIQGAVENIWKVSGWKIVRNSRTI